MARINSRNKGATTERKACKVLKAWARKEFSRVPASGGLGWHNSQSTGDIMCIKEGHYFPFSVEVKARDSINFEHLLYLKKAEILDFWAQSVKDAKRVNKCPMVMMRYNGLPNGFFFVLLPRIIYHKFFKEHIPEEDPILVASTHGFAIISSWSLMRTPYKEIRKPLMQYLKENEI